MRLLARFALLLALSLTACTDGRILGSAHRQVDALLAQSKMTIVSSTSDRNDAALAIDGNPSTAWTAQALPAEIVIDLGNSYDVTGWSSVGYRDWTPAQRYESYVSNDFHSWGEPVALGVNTSRDFDVEVKRKQGRYLRLVYPAGQGLAGYAFTAELNITAAFDAVTDDVCRGGVLCDDSPVTGAPGREVCGDDLMMWRCESGSWQAMQRSCTCDGAGTDPGGGGPDGGTDPGTDDPGTTPDGDSPKGEWGRAHPIAENNHPNLFYNRSELDELRQMILVDHSPAHLYQRYVNEVQGVLALPANPGDEDARYWIHQRNSIAALSYAIEPTEEKAAAIRLSLLSHMDGWPNGLSDWFSGSGPFFAGYSQAFLFDLIQAYHPNVLSSGEKAALKQWFLRSAQSLKWDTRDPRAVSQDGTLIIPPSAREGKYLSDFPNWYSRYMGPSLACAMVSGDQDAVDYWADSGWPHQQLSFDGVWDPQSPSGARYPSDAANRYDVVMYLLAVYPSGANTDSYTREGYRAQESDWWTTDYTSGGYHWAQMDGAMLGAEMVFHNGMSRVFEISGNSNGKPALLAHYQRAALSRFELDRRTGGHPTIANNTQLFLGWRRYSDPAIDQAVTEITNDGGQLELPDVVWEFLGYPRHTVWSQ